MLLSPGTLVDEVEIVVETGKILEFVRATGVTDPVHANAATARSAGFDAVPATPTYVVVTGHHRNQQEFVSLLGLDITRVVVGSVAWSYERPLVAGDQLVARRIVADDRTKASRTGGSNRLVTLETEFLTPDGSVVARQREVLVERGRS